MTDFLTDKECKELLVGKKCPNCGQAYYRWSVHILLCSGSKPQ